MASIDSSVLDKRCSSAHIAKISEHIENWQELAPYFGLTEVEEQEILNNHAHQYKVQKCKMVWKWVRKQGVAWSPGPVTPSLAAASRSLLLLHDPPRGPGDQAKQGDRATYRGLKRVFEEAGESLLVSRVDEFLQDAYSQVVSWGLTDFATRKPSGHNCSR